MKRKFSRAMAALLAGTGMALGQGPGQPTSSWSPIVAPAARPVTLPEAAPNSVVPLLTGSPYAGTVTGVTTVSPVVLRGTPEAAGHPAACGPKGCATDACGDRGLYAGQVWGSVEYLLWWVREGDLQPLVGTIPGTLLGGGSLPSGAINPLFGGPAGDLDYDEHSGMRFTVGYWFDPDQQLGVEASYFLLERKPVRFSDTSGRDPVLGPLYFDPVINRQVIVFPASTNLLSTTVTAHASERLWGFETNARIRTSSVFSDRVDVLVGFRHVQFDEGLSVFSTGTFQPAADSTGVRQSFFDSFGVHNRYYAVQAGLTGDARWSGWFLHWAAKVALGVVNESVTIQGGSAQTSADGVVTRFPGGILAQTTNIGKQTSDKFAVMPEVTVNVGYQVTEQLRAFVGYNFLFISNVARVGDQIDGVDGRGVRLRPGFDPTVSPERPFLPFNTTQFWAQGLNFGLEYRY